MIEANSERDTAILSAATRIINDEGITALTRSRVAEVAQMSPASVSNFGRTSITNSAPPADGFKQRVMSALMAAAIAAGDLPMLRVGLVGGFIRRDELPDPLRADVGV